MSILEAKELYFTYPDGDRTRVILDHVNYAFEEGVFYAILGESGSGKTTFLSLLAGLDAPVAGEITFRDKSVSEIGYEKYRRNDIGIVFQSYNLIPYLTGVENVLVSMSATDNELPKDKRQYAFELLASLGINETKAKRRINRLSGGEQQRVAIARALATQVDILLADEPTGNLDESIGRMIVDIFSELAHEKNKCVIVVTHSKELADRADRILKLDSTTGQFEEIINTMDRL